MDSSKSLAPAAPTPFLKPLGWLFSIITAHIVVAGLGVILITAGLFTYLYRTPTSLILTALLFCCGIIGGLLIAVKLIGLFLGQAARSLEAEVSPEDVLTIKRDKTGLAQVDALLELHEKKVFHLTETIDEIGEKSEVLIERYGILTEHLAAAVVIRDEEGKIAYCSPYTEVLTGYSLSEIYGAKEDFFVSIIHEADREKYTRSLKVSSAGEAFQFTYRFYHKSGIEMWAETRTVPLLDDNGTGISSLSITLDVTGTVRYQKQVEEQNRDLQDFTYMVTHDLKAPIFTIKGMLALIEEDFGDKLEPELAEPVSHITSATKRLETLVASVLEYAKLTALESISEAVPLSAIAQDIMSDYSHQFKELNAKVSVTEPLPVITGDRIRVYQLFSNLIGNAVKYRSPERPLEIQVSLEKSSNARYSTICVKDNGLGIPSDRVEAIFRPFQRAHGGQIEGSGIGLACVKKIVEKFGGSVRVESEEGHGSSFFVVLKNYSG
ncbi:PAS domain-containing sensor histidine kinase [Oligoflexia bacterium]|nr:PAS domain-containing sensor histidine kinase [Oligoflexia bacterium]